MTNSNRTNQGVCDYEGNEEEWLIASYFTSQGYECHHAPLYCVFFTQEKMCTHIMAAKEQTGALSKKEKHCGSKLKPLSVF